MVSGMRYADRYLYFGGIGLVVIAIFAPLRNTPKVWELFTENVSWLGATCCVTMVGHTHAVRCLQSDDNRVISGSYDHTLKIWDIATGRCTHTLRGHTDHVVCVQFKDDMLVSGSGDCTIIVWDLSTYEMKRTLRGHKAAVTTLQFDSSRIISGSLDRLIKIWDLGTWKIGAWGLGVCILWTGSTQRATQESSATSRPTTGRWSVQQTTRHSRCGAWTVGSGCSHCSHTQTVSLVYSSMTRSLCQGFTEQ